MWRVGYTFFMSELGGGGGLMWVFGEDGFEMVLWAESISTAL